MLGESAADEKDFRLQATDRQLYTPRLSAIPWPVVWSLKSMIRCIIGLPEHHRIGCAMRWCSGLRLS